MKTLAVKIDGSIVERAKKIVKDSGINWGYFVTKQVEKSFNDLKSVKDVEKIIRG